MARTIRSSTKEFGGHWDQLERQAASDALLGGGYDRPLLELVRASSGTILREFYPFTSMCRLCLARRPYPFEGI